MPRLFWLALAIFSALVATNDIATTGSRQALEEISRIGDLRRQARTAVRLTIVAESHLRGYLLTGAGNFQEAYETASRQSQYLLESIARETADSANGMDGQTADALKRLGHALSDRLGELTTIMQIQASGQPDAWQKLMTTAQSQQRVASAAEAAQAVDDRLDTLQTEAERHVLIAAWLSRAGLVIVGLIGLVCFYLYLRQAVALRRHMTRQQALIREDRDRLDLLARRRTAALGELATHLQNVREDERARLARELHDELGSLLTAAKLDLARLRPKLAADGEASERMKHLGSTLDQCIAVKRGIIEDLHPSSLSNLGLSPALDILLQEFAQRSGIQVSSTLQVDARLPEAIELTIYRLLQEACTNIAKYAQAHHVIVCLSRSGKHITIAVHDDGIGFDPKNIRKQAHGLYGMRHRVESLNGQLSIDSLPGRGTRLEATIPYPDHSSPSV